MRRRRFIWLIGGAAATWPLVAQGQQREQIRRVGVLFGGPNNENFKTKLTAFQETLQRLGWVEGRNIQFDVRWDINPQRLSEEARALVRMEPDVILVGPTVALLALKKETDKIPIVFVTVSDPLGRGVVTSLSRPTANITGFSNLEFSLIGKYLQIIKDLAPETKRIGIMIHASNAVSDSWFRMFNTVAPSFGMKPFIGPIHDRAEIEHMIEFMTQEPHGALVVPGDSYVESEDVGKFIVRLAELHRLPVLYTQTVFVHEGGLICYGVDQIEQYRGAASYVDRLLKGEKPAHLPVQQPTKFNLVINVKAAKSLGLTVPQSLLVAADEVIE